MTPNDSKSGQLAGNIRRLHSQATASTDESALVREELEALVRVQLGEDHDRSKIAAVANFQRWWRDEQQAATAKLQRGEVTPEGYLTLLRSLTSEMAAQCERVLGDKDFERLFGVPAKDAADLLTPPIPWTD